MSTKKQGATPVAEGRWHRFLNSVSIYWLELVIAMISLLVTGSVIAVSAYALFNALASGTGFVGYGSLWFAASAAVWAPLAFIFYARVRSHELRTDGLTDSGAQRTMVIVYQVLTLVVAISFAFVTIYTLLISLTRDDILTPLLQSAVPSLISAALFGLLYVAFFRHAWLSRRTFLIVMTVFAVVVIVPAMVASVLQIRADVKTNNTPANQNMRTYDRYDADDDYYYDNSYRYND